MALPQLPGGSASAMANMVEGNLAAVEPGTILIDEPMHDASNDASRSSG